MVAPHVAEAVRELETLLARIRHRIATLLDLDMWDRWGKQHASGQEIAERAENERFSTTDRAAATSELEALVTKLRASHPEAIVAWANAHDTFLDLFIAGATDKTAIFVATQEREEWAAVKRGEKLFVEENCYYITIDRELYRDLFGVEP